MVTYASPYLESIPQFMPEDFWKTKVYLNETPMLIMSVYNQDEFRYLDYENDLKGYLKIYASQLLKNESVGEEIHTCTDEDFKRLEPIDRKYL